MAFENLTRSDMGSSIASLSGMCPYLVQNASSFQRCAR